MPRFLDVATPLGFPIALVECDTCKALIARDATTEHENWHTKGIVDAVRQAVRQSGGDTAKALG